MFYPQYRPDRGLVDGTQEMLQAIKEANLPTEYKNAILAKMAAYDCGEASTNLHIKETILTTLEMKQRPMQVKEFIGEYDGTGYYPWDGNGVLGHFPHQRVNAHMRQLVMAGLVKRSKVETGREIEIKPGKFIKETIVVFELA